MKAFLLVDIQKDYFSGGKGELQNPVQAAQKAKMILEHFRKNSLPVIFIRHLNTKVGGKIMLPNTEGSEIHGLVEPLPEECIIIKHAPNSFYQTGLAVKLRDMGIHELVVCGMMSHMCIDTTVRSASDYGFSTILIHDACATKDLKWNGKILPADTVHGVFMASMSGAFATIMSAEEYLCEQQE